MLRIWISLCISRGSRSKCYRVCGFSVLPEVAPWQLWRCVKAGVSPFLRCAALFFHYLNSTAPPTDLLGNSAITYPDLCVNTFKMKCIHVLISSMIRMCTVCVCVCFVDTGPGQWEALCSYLSLPSNPLQLYQNQQTLLEPLIQR